MSNVKIPRWIVKALISSVILKSPSVSSSYSLFPRYAFVAVVKRVKATRQKSCETKTRTGLPQKNTLVLDVVHYSYVFRVFTTASGKAQQKRTRRYSGTVNRVENKKHIEMTAFHVPVAVSQSTLREIMLVIIPRTRPCVHPNISAWSPTWARARVGY